MKFVVLCIPDHLYDKLVRISDALHIPASSFVSGLLASYSAEMLEDALDACYDESAE